MKYKIIWSSGVPYIRDLLSCSMTIGTCLFQRAFEPGVHQLLSLCTDHGISLLYTTLPPGAKDMYKHLHSDYLKHHRYTGSV